MDIFLWFNNGVFDFKRGYEVLKTLQTLRKQNIVILTFFVRKVLKIPLENKKLKCVLKTIEIVILTDVLLTSKNKF